MAKSANLNIRIDPETKAQVEQLFSNFGMNVSDAVNIFLHQSLIYGGLPFQIKIDKPNEETLKAMQEVDDMIKNGTGKKYNSVDELFKELDS